MIKVAYIEDDPYLRDFISDAVAADRDLELTLCCGSVEDYLDRARFGTRPEVLLLDIELPGISGLEAIGQLKSFYPATEIAMFTVYDDADRIFKSLCAGASGYLLKSTTFPRLKEGIIQIYRGESAMTPSVARKVIQHFRPVPTPREELTVRERQIVQAMVDGLSYKLIADRLMISVNTVCYHVKNIYTKLQVNSKAEVIARSLKGEV